MSSPFESIKRLIKKTWSNPPSMASRDLLALYHTNPRLDGVRIIANKCASTELYLYNRKDFRKNKNNAEIIEEHEIYDLLENPCPNFRELTGWSVKYFVFACYALVGEAYLLKIRDPKGKVISLSPLSPSWVVSTPTTQNNYWEIYPYGTLGGNSIKVPNEDVIYFKDINLLDPFGRGHGSAETIGDEIQSDEYASKYAKNLFFNDATPSAIIYAPQGNKETADQIKKSWLQKMAGYRHAKEPMVLTGEGSKFEKISQSPQELDFVESRRFLRDSALQQFHIPPEIVGILESSNRSTIDSAFYLLNKNVLADYLRMYERVMNAQLLWEEYDKEKTLILHHENTIEEDIQQKLQIADSGLRNGTLTVNDWRRAMGYEIDEKGGDVYLRSFSQVEVPYNSEPIELPDTEPQEPVELPEEETEVELSLDEYEQIKKEYVKKYRMLTSDADKERRVKTWKVFDARARAIEVPFVKAMQKAFDKQNELCKKAVSDAVEKNKDVGTAIENLYGNEMNDALKHTLASAFFNGLTVGAEHGAELLNKKDCKAISEEVRRAFNLWIDNYGLDLATEINETTKKKLRKVLSEAIEDGASIQEQKKRLLEVVDDTFAQDKTARALLIARTESCTTINAGSLELYKTENVQMKEWIAVQDDRTREAHSLIDGTVVPITDKFEIPATSETDVAYLDYAGDASAPAEQVCNCRCTIAPFVTLGA